MTDRDASVIEDELPAYVDGMLREDRRRVVEAWLANHPKDAARVAAWRSQAERIRTSYAGITEESIPERLDLKVIGKQILKSQKG